MLHSRRSQNSSFKLALLIFIFLHVGLILELILIGHYESFWQYIPLIALTLGLFSLALVLRVRQLETIKPFINRSLILVKICYLLTIVTGVLGVFLHLKNNWEFELEMYSGLENLKLIQKSFTGALPVLAPGTLVPFGLMGFLLLNLKSNKDK